MTIASRLALLLPLLCATPALAQGTEAQRAACGPDAFRLCAASIPDPGRIAACLRRERDRLSGVCRAMLDEADTAARTAAAPAPREDATPRATARTRAAGTAREAAPPPRTARAESGRRIAARPALPRAAPRTEAVAEAPRVATRAARRRVAARERTGFESFERIGETAQTRAFTRTLSAYAGSIERAFSGIGSVDLGSGLPGLVR